MKTPLQNTSDVIKPEKDIESDITPISRTRRKLRLDDLLDKFEKAQKDSQVKAEDREWLNSAPVGKELL